jgi:hypothetical protein
MKEKKSAVTVHKRIKNTSLVNAVDEGNVVVGLHRLQVLINAKRSLVTRIALGGQKQ